MGEGMGLKLCLLLILSSIGVLAVDWSVRLPSSPVCAVVGATVVLPCTYDYPQSSRDWHPTGQLEQTNQVKVLSEIWCLEQGRCITQRYVFHSDGIFLEPSYRDRVNYLGEPGSKNCSLSISDLKASDSGTYVFYIITSYPAQKMPEQTGIQLLIAESSSSVTSLVSPCGDITVGVDLRLACCSPAVGPEARYRWYKNPSVTTRKEGQLWSMSYVQANATGTYYCQVQTTDGTYNSANVTIDVQYPPRNTAVSVSPSGQLPEGGAVALTCSSDANPPVHTYTWHRGPACLTLPVSNTDLASKSFMLPPARTPGQMLLMANITVEDAGQYCCLASNTHGSKDYTVTLTVGTARDQSVSNGVKRAAVGVTVAVLVAVIAIVACVICRRRSALKQQSYALTETTATAP